MFASFVPSNSTDCQALQQLFPACCRGPAAYDCEQRIHQNILEAGINTAVPPISDYNTPLNITVSLMYQGVTKIDVQAGTGEIFVWVDLLWVDPRLAWSVGPQDCASLVTVRASLDVEKTEIWVPDFDLYNQVRGVSELPEAMAEVYPDGTVLWRRNGPLNAICQFSGLAQIPFDTLGCQFLLGPWNRVHLNQINYKFADHGGLSFGDFKPSYNQFVVVPELSEHGISESSAAMFYTFYFRRARSYYVFNIIIPTTILTFVSFGTFLLDLRVGERLSYGVSLAVVVVAQQIVTKDLIPVSDERLWIDRFVGWSFYWVIFGLVESVFIGYLFFIRDDFEREPVHAEEAAGDKDAGHAFAELDEGNEVAGDQPGSHLEQIPEDSTTPADKRNGWEPSRSLSFANFRQTLRRTRSRRKESITSRKRDKKPGPLPNCFYHYPLRRIDHFCFFSATITYIIFLICMFSTRSFWGQNVDPVYVT
jgi:hypothetical protein